MEFSYTIKGGDFSKAGHASSEVKKMLKQLGIDPKCIKNIVIALYEAEVNVVAHAWEGEILVKIDTEKIELKIIDKGPGIPDIDKAMQEGYSTASKKVREMGFAQEWGFQTSRKTPRNLQLTQ